MKSKIHIVFSILFLFFQVVEVNSQFRFGLFIKPSLNQIDGDNLQGFHHTGVSFGLLGGYKLNNENSINIDLGYNSMGSNRGSENIPNEINRILLETDINTINILMGYQFQFGNRWDGKKYYLLKAGVNYHRIIKNNHTILSNHFGVTNEQINEKDFNSQYVALNVAVGKILSQKISTHIGIDYGFGNLLKLPQFNISRLSVYQVFFNINYYVF